MATGLVADWIQTASRSPFSLTSAPGAALQSMLDTLTYIDPGIAIVAGPNFNIIKALGQWRILSEVEVAATALFFFDYILTMGMEINLIWAAKWNWIKLLYLAQRYAPFIDAGFITIYRHVGTNFAKSHCERMTIVTGVLTIGGTLTSELLLTIRVWAIWNRTLKFGLVLLAGFIGVWIPASIAGYLYTASIIYPESPPYAGFRGCFIMYDKPLVVWCWASLLIWDLLCLILVAIPAFYTYRSGLSSSTRLTYVVYRDGTVYYVFLFVISVINIVFSSRLPASCRVVTMSMTRCLHSALASRVLLQLREQIEAESDTFVMEDEMSLNMMGTMITVDDDDVFVTRGYGTHRSGHGRDLGVDSIGYGPGPLYDSYEQHRSRRGRGRGGRVDVDVDVQVETETEVRGNGSGSDVMEGGGKGQLPAVDRRWGKGSRRHSAAPTVTSSAE